MARTLNAATHAVRRDEILDVAERQIRTVGYDAMSIQALQDELGVSRGAIYHYFRSKEAILAAVIDRMTRPGMAMLEPIAHDPDLPAVDKLQAVFTVGSRGRRSAVTCSSACCAPGTRPTTILSGPGPRPRRSPCSSRCSPGSSDRAWTRGR